jgi:hypothetical protein
MPWRLRCAFAVRRAGKASRAGAAGLVRREGARGAARAAAGRVWRRSGAATADADSAVFAPLCCAAQARRVHSAEHLISQTFSYAKARAR